MVDHLREIDTADLHAELQRRKAEADRVLHEKLHRLSVFIREHPEDMLLFFELGGCKRPHECVQALTIEPYETPHSVPVAYTRRFREEGDFFTAPP